MPPQAVWRDLTLRARSSVVLKSKYATTTKRESAVNQPQEKHLGSDLEASLFNLMWRAYRQLMPWPIQQVFLKAKRLRTRKTNKC